MTSQPHEVLGRVGTMTVACRGAGTLGEVQLSIRGGTERFLAVSTEVLAVGTQVLVVERLPHRTVVVARWDDPAALMSKGGA